MAQKKQKRQPTGDYEVGYCRAPAQYRFRPGQSGNPTGERKAKATKSTADELKEIVNTKVTIGSGDKARKVSLPSAILLAHGMNAAKGDPRSAALYFNQVHRMGLLDDQASGDVRRGPSGNSRFSDVVLAGVDLATLSRDEQVELSQLAAIINRDGSIWALDASQLERVRELVNKGRASDAARH